MAVPLPNEIVHKILKTIDGDDIGRCRRVCRQWRNVADDMNDCLWKEKCAQSFRENYEIAQEKSSLAWKELYKSLSLWNKVKSSRVRSNWNSCSGSILKRPIVLQFKVLNDGTAGCPYNTDFDFFHAHYNSIQYYDLKNHCFTEEDRFFKYTFVEYAENEKLIVLKDHMSGLHVITKANNEEHLIGEVGINLQFFLFENCIYFTNEDGMICIAQLKEEDGNVSVETSTLCTIETDIILITYVNADHVNFLTIHCEIFSLIGTDIKMIDAFQTTANRNTIIRTLTRHGFDWSDPSLYRWLTLKGWSNGPCLQIAKFKNATVYKHGKVILVGTYRRVLHIYYNPYGINGDLKLYSSKPTKSVNLNTMYPVSERYKKRTIEQIDVKETINGHQVIINYCQRLVVLELTHDGEDPKEPKYMMIDYYEDWGTSGSESCSKGEFSSGAGFESGMSEKANNDGTSSLDTGLKMAAPGSERNNEVGLSLEAEYKRGLQSDDDVQPLKKTKN